MAKSKVSKTRLGNLERAMLLQLDYAAARITTFVFDLTAGTRTRKSTAYGETNTKA